MADMGDVRDRGRKAVHSLRRSVAQRMIELLEQRDPELLGSMVEVGIVRRGFRDDPSRGPLRDVAPIEVVERLLERSVERRPSILSRLGLSTIQVLATSGDDDIEGHGVTTRMAVAFTDLEGFTRFTATRGDEPAAELLAVHHRTVGPIVRGRGGRIVKRLGDGLLLTFPEPEAACLACLELVAAQPSPLRLRAGVHVGDVVMTRDDVIGHVVNVAARVCESARGGEVLSTTDVRAAVSSALGAPAGRAAAPAGGLVFGRARRRGFKGVAEAVSVCQVDRR